MYILWPFMRREFRCRVALTLSLLAIAMGCANAALSQVPTTLRLNQLQILGSHNSYRPYPSPLTEARMRQLSEEHWHELAYGHPPLEAQLALGLRQFELDVGADPTGGLYAKPYDQARPEIQALMAAPGAKVLHFPNFDTDTHCLTFRTCLAIFDRWSKAHPDHDPIVILVNSSDFPKTLGQLPHDANFDASTINELDADIAAVIGSERVITPDMVRGKFPTLRDAVLAGNWPDIAHVRGHFLFVLDGNTNHEALYREGHPSLSGRLMFGFYDASEPEAAIFNIQDPVNEQGHIRDLVQKGFIVRTRADADTEEARVHDDSRMRAALASGAQLISTDYYAGVPDPLALNYTADFQGPYFRCNPVVAHCAPQPQIDNN